MTVQALQTIESQDFTLGNLFNSFYAVPSFQREYVWKEQDVEQLLRDIFDEFSSDDRSDASEYFVGSIIVCARADGVFELIDGQQRMTTAYLVLCGMRDFLKSMDPPTKIDALAPQIAASDVDDFGEDVYRYRVTLQYPDSCEVLAKIASGVSGVERADIPRTTRSVENILNAYDAIVGFLRERFGGDPQSVRRFYAYITRNVKLIRVTTISLAHALKVFETINDRGVGLDSMDLLKNLMFMEAGSQDYDRLNVTWKKLVDTLYRAHEKPLRFLRYYILAHYRPDRLREDEIYKWFVDNAELCGYRSRPVRFVEDLLEDAAAYAHFIAGHDASGAPNRYLSNIAYLSGAARQHFILLLAARHISPPLFADLSRHLENLYFAYIISREPTKEFEYRFTEWASEVRLITDKAELDSFIAKRIQPAKEAFAARFKLAFRALDEQSLQKYRLRYVLAKLAQWVDEQAWGSDSRYSNLANYISNKIDVEHILPQTPSPEVIAAFDMPDAIPAYVHRLGNLTLVEKSINCAVGNGLFTAKRSAYRQSHLLLTKTLGERVVVGVDTRVDRAVRELETFHVWTTGDIERRQDMLGRLAHKVWDMPDLDGASETRERTA